MVSFFDLQKLDSLLKDFYAITNIRITVFDESLNELISFPQNVAPYCEVIRETTQGLEACMKCDRDACMIAGKRKGTYVYQCHAGLTEAVTPLFVGNILVGFLFFGHVFSYESKEDGIAEIEENTSEIKIDQRMLREALSEHAKYIPEEYVRSAAHILRAVASFLIMERMASLKQDQIAVRLDSYISANFTKKIGVDSICKTLDISKNRLYRLSHQLYGCGIAEHIRNLRINLAKDLLASSDSYSLGEIADKCGYDDYNYFIALFSKETGCSPTKWRMLKLKP